MIIDLRRFVSQERPHWDALEQLLERAEADVAPQMPLEKVREFHYLYMRASADLARVATFSGETELRRYLETLVSRAYAHVHAGAVAQGRFAPRQWILETFPSTFRRHAGAFGLAALITTMGVLFGALALLTDLDAKSVLLPFEHLQSSPSERVSLERENVEMTKETPTTGFAATLMTHNIRVSILTAAMGMTWGIGTILLLFHNGIILGAVTADYASDGQTIFLLGWLLPHGSIEIPAILVAGQVGFVLAGALIGRGRRLPFRARMRAAGPDLVILITGLALMLIWAGLIEAFFSQYHEPLLPYWAKILFGSAQLICLGLYLALCGRASDIEA